jgi:hypothetical protein
MLASGNPEWISRAQLPGPVEGSWRFTLPSSHDKFVVFVEARLGSDVSIFTSRDPQRNQIARKISTVSLRKPETECLFSGSS